MNIIFSILIAIIIVLLLTILAAWLDRKEKVQFVDTIIDKVSSLIDSKAESVTGQSDTGPWYLVVYTYETDYPIWISHNNIRSVHPDPANNKIIVKQFNGEDIVIENVERYKLCPSEDMCNYEM